MSEEKITGLEFLKDIPKTNGLVSAYGSVNLEQLSNVIKRLKKIPNYDELLKENNNLEQENKQLKSILTELEEWLELRYPSKHRDWLSPEIDTIKEKIKLLKEKYK